MDYQEIEVQLSIKDEDSPKENRQPNGASSFNIETNSNFSPLKKKNLNLSILIDEDSDLAVVE